MNFEHLKIVELIKELDLVPDNDQQFSDWIKAESHLNLLRHNALQDELIMYACGEYSFIYAGLIKIEDFDSLDIENLLDWHANPYSSISSYVYGGGKDEVWLEKNTDRDSFDKFNIIKQLVFVRSFEGIEGSERNYIEINQEYTHAAGIHWKQEHNAYCNFDENGDLAKIVSITMKANTLDEVTCVTFSFDNLEEYLAATKSVIIRRFDFTLLRRDRFSSWSDEPEKIIKENNIFVYRQKIMPGHAAYTTGIQIIGPRKPLDKIYAKIKGERDNEKYVEFVAHDWRNNKIVNISTNPEDTTNYFEAKYNDLPYELSPVFFKPEVLSKYKTDKEKYTISERDITCRASWYLEAYDVNEAGQVFAYVCYLRRLPYSELLHWLSYNEPPKASISNRALENDFKGEFTNEISVLQKLRRILDSWVKNKTIFWSLRDERLLQTINIPLTSSKTEWADAFMDLSKLIVEGFEIKVIRKKLDEENVSYANDEKSIKLLERLLVEAHKIESNETLKALREIQYVRSKIGGHVAGSEASEYIKNIYIEYGNLTQHYKAICDLLCNELDMISMAFE